MKRILTMAVVAMLTLATFSQAQATSYIGKVCTLKKGATLFTLPSDGSNPTVILSFGREMRMVVTDEKSNPMLGNVVLEVGLSYDNASVSGWVPLSFCKLSNPSSR